MQLLGSRFLPGKEKKRGKFSWRMEDEEWKEIHEVREFCDARRNALSQHKRNDDGDDDGDGDDDDGDDDDDDDEDGNDGDDN